MVYIKKLEVVNDELDFRIGLQINNYMSFKSNNYVDFSASNGEIIAKIGAIYPQSISMKKDIRIFEIHDVRYKIDKERDYAIPLPLSVKWVDAFNRFIISGDTYVSLDRNYVLDLDNGFIRKDSINVAKIHYIHQLQTFFKLTFGINLTFDKKKIERISKSENLKFKI